ncbi:hypothetical protein EDB85DRAFT_1259404 [Lactarius pseudohatsudake]|nr:hypothetical protein EDB85DRAFT_1259404 [Lactarius pseudohatsudake]
MAVMSPKNHFDKLSFLKYMKNIGRAYRKQATELISICRFFVQVGERSVRQDAYLRKVLEFADDALRAAADTKDKTSEGTDKKFEGAIIALSAYEQKYHEKQRDLVQIAERMKSAKKKDKSSSNILYGLFKQRFKEKPEPVEAPTEVVQFLLSGSLPDKDPEVVKQALCRKSNMEEVLWNFSRLKGKQRITLKQNPHFYRGLPSSGSAYSDCFTTYPIYEFWDTTDEIRVLTDERSRVFLETDKRNRAFGNFWMPDRAIIFKDVGGKLEGEGIVAKDIQGTPNLWQSRGAYSSGDRTYNLSSDSWRPST